MLLVGASVACGSPAADGKAAAGQPLDSHADKTTNADAAARSAQGPFASSAPLPAATKGYELYAWEQDEKLRFMLITGTNRQKTLEEITALDSRVENGEWVAVSGSSLEDLEQLLKRVPSGASVLLNERADLTPLSAPARQQIKALLARFDS
jgi:hypothetical protein